MPTTPFHTALNTLAALNVPGITHNYALDALPEKLTRAQLPALLVVPLIESSRRRQYGEFQMAAPSGSRALARYLITHLLLYAPVTAGRGARSSLPGLVDLVDAYGAALKLDPLLGGALFLPVNYSAFIAPTRFAGVEYHAAQFWHTLTVAV